MTATNVISIAMRTATDVGIRRYDGPIVADPAALDDDYLAAAREHLLSLCRRIDAAEVQP